MKVTFILLVATFVTYASEGFSQSKGFTFQMQGVNLIEVFNQIEEQSNMQIAYDISLIDVNRRIDIEVKGESVEKVLDKALDKTNLTYRIMNRYIVISKNEGGSTSKSVQQLEKVSGKVTDGDGMPLPGVTVVVKGTTKGTITTDEGTYSLPDVSSDAVLVFSFVGMRTQEIEISGKSMIDVTMAEESIGLEEVVAVGYGTQKKVNLTGAVSSVKFDDMSNSRPLTNVSSALSGLSSGVTVRQSGGRPGDDGATIRVRGIGTLNNSNPLIIIDGMEGSLDAVNPRDIESFSILKDAASASIYGSRAANGVILVTTKKGDKKDLSVTYNGSFSIAQPTNLLSAISDYPTYMSLMNESASNVGTAELFSQSTISAWETANQNPNALNEIGVPNYVAFPNTDWSRQMYQNNLIQDHNVSVNGATDKARFLLSSGFIDNPGLVEYTGMKRYSLRSNVEIDINKWLTVGTRTFGSMDNLGLGNYDEMLKYVNQTSPGLYPRYEGRYGYPEAPEETTQGSNLYKFLNGSLGGHQVTRLNSTLYSKVQLLKGLSWDVNFNYSKRFDEQNSRTNPKAIEKVRFSNGEVVAGENPPDQLVTRYQILSDYSYTLENLLHYNTTLAEKHHIGGLLGYNETYYSKYNTNVAKKGLIDEGVYVFDAATTMLSSEGNATDWALRSWFGRLTYDFSERYLLEMNLRYDGSSRFDDENRHGIFPSVAAAWRISEEGFMSDSEFFQNLKLRVSWGELGNNATKGNYDYQALYSTASYSFNGTQITGLYPAKIANSALQWESTAVTNFGLDATVLDGRLSAELDIYNKVTDGILTTPPIYLTLGLINAPTLNTAEVTNKGLELSLSWRDQIGEVKYSISGNFGYNHNEVTGYKGKLVEEWRTDEEGNDVYYSNLGDVSSGGDKRILEDHTINEWYLRDVYKGNGAHFNGDGSVNVAGGPEDGMIRTQEDMDWLNAMIAEGYQFMPDLGVANNKIWYGDLIYADLNGDGIYGNTFDRSFTGSSAMPKFVFGSQMSISWNNFDLSMIWSGQAGVKLYWLESGYNDSNTRIGNAIGELVGNDHYFFNVDDPGDAKNNIDATYPRLKLNGGGQNSQASTRWLYDGSFLRLKNLTVGYTLPSRIANKIYTKNLRVYVSAENLLTITSFPGLDPEMGGDTNYPLIRQIAFGTNITF